MPFYICLPASFVVYILLRLLLIRSINEFRLIFGSLILLLVAQKVPLNSFPFLEGETIICFVVVLMHDSDVNECLQRIFSDDLMLLLPSLQPLYLLIEILYLSLSVLLVSLLVVDL